MKYVIADIHGEITKLKQLIEFVLSTDFTPEFIFIGDYIDKGENSKSTLEFLVRLDEQYNCVFLMGNHEYCWLNAILYEDYLLKYGGRNTMNSFGCISIKETQKKMLDEYGVFFNLLKNYHITNSFFISHSGIPPEQYFENNFSNITQQSYLFNRYPFITYDQLFQNKYRVIFGHTGFYKPFINEYKIGIDTAACYLETQPLTCFCIETEVFYNSSEQKYALEELKGEFCPNIVRVKPWRIDD